MAVDLKFTEFFYSQRPEELGEYRRLKSLKILKRPREKGAFDAKAELLLSEIKAKSPYRNGKRRRKRNRKRKRKRGGKPRR